MNPIEIATLFFMMAALAALPSASVALVITRAATLGVANGIAVAAGIVLGDLVFMILAILGLAIIAETLGGLFIIMKVLGGVYLIWLGISLWRSQNGLMTKPQTHHYQLGILTSFISGFLLTLGDVKAILFYGSLFPMIIELSVLRAIDLVVIITTIVIAVGGVKVMYALFATKAAQMAEARKLSNVSQKAAGGLMVGAGSYLLLKA